MSSFSFIADDTLRTNLDTAFDHINELVAVSESETYREKPVQISSFRKTIIIHIAAIIEALLLWKLKQVVVSKKVELEDEWKYLDLKVLHKINDSEQVVAGRRKKVKGKIDKLDFLHITRLCVKHKILKSTRLEKDIDRVRTYRNRQHLGGLREIERDYSKTDLEFCFSVAERVRTVVSG